jgi:hypothetical protein
VCPCANEDDLGRISLVDQQEVAADMSFAVICPIALERVIPPLGTERPVVRDQEKHCLLQSPHVEPS